MSSSERADVTAIDAMYASALRSFQAGDLEAVLDHWEETGAYIWPAVPPSIGKEAIRAAYEGFFTTWTAQETYQPTRSQYRGASHMGPLLDHVDPDGEVEWENHDDEA